MRKLPVADIIRFAYEFTFGQLGTIIGLIWAPMVGIAVLRFLPYGMGDMSLSPDNPTAMGAAALRELVFGLLSILLYACITVAVVRQALGLRKGGAIIHFSLGVTELRMAGATIALGLIIGFLGVIFVFGAVAAIAASASLGGKTAASLVALGVLTVGSCVLVVSIVRLAYLVVPITVVENRISFERGWVLTHGNFWRIAAVLFAVTLPVAVVEFSAVFALMGSEIVALLRVAPQMSQEVFADRLQTVVNGHISMIIGINLIVAPFSFGLMLGAAAAGYRALTADAAPAAGHAA